MKAHVERHPDLYFASAVVGGIIAAFVLLCAVLATHSTVALAGMVAMIVASIWLMRTADRASTLANKTRRETRRDEMINEYHGKLEQIWGAQRAGQFLVAVDGVDSAEEINDLYKVLLSPPRD